MAYWGRESKRTKDMNEEMQKLHKELRETRVLTELVELCFQMLLQDKRTAFTRLNDLT